MAALTTYQDALAAAEAAAARGDMPAAADALRRAAELQTAALGPAHPDLANTLNNLGVAAERLGWFDVAEASYRRATAIAKTSLPADHPFVETSRRNLREFCDLRRIPFEGESANDAAAAMPAPTKSTPHRASAPPVPRPVERAAPAPVSASAPVSAPAPAPAAASAPSAAPAALKADKAASETARRPESKEAAAGRTPVATSPAVDPDVFRQTPPPPVAGGRKRGGGLFVVAMIAAVMAAGWLYSRRNAPAPETSPSTSPPAAEAPVTPTPAPASAPATKAPASSPAVAPPSAAAPSSSSPSAGGSVPPSAGSAPAAPSARGGSTPQPEPFPRASSSTSTGTAAKPDEHGLAVVDARLCRSLNTRSREWTCTAPANPAEAGVVYFLTRIVTPQDLAMEHRWYRRDTLVRTKRISVPASGAPGYRAYSQQPVDARGGGEWRVDLVTREGRVVESVRFGVK